MDKIDRLLTKAGVPPRMAGYFYTRDALKLLQEDETYLTGFTKRLYPKIAEMHGTTWHGVERGIRLAAERAFSTIKPETKEELFGNCVDPNKGVLTNKNFLALLLLDLE